MLVISTHIPKSPQKVRNWSDPPPPLRQMTIEKLLFFRDGFPLYQDKETEIVHAQFLLISGRYQ